MKFEVEELFTPSRWFVMFCGALVIVWLALQWVANMRLEEDARVVAKNVFDWQWPGNGWDSAAEITGVSVLQRTDTDAVVEVKGKQTLGVPQSGATGQKVETTDCAVKLSFYRTNKAWTLGAVDIE